METRRLLAADALGAGAPDESPLSAGELFLPGSISGVVFESTHGDGLRPQNAPGIEGVQLELLDAEGRLMAAATTDAAGRYEFVALPPGMYAVRERQPAGMFDGLEWVGSGGGLVHLDADLISGIAVAPGVALVGYDFAEHAGAVAAESLVELLAGAAAWITEPVGAVQLRNGPPAATNEAPPSEATSIKREAAVAPLPRVEPIIAAVNHEVKPAELSEAAAVLEALEADTPADSALGEANAAPAPAVRLVELPRPRTADAAARDQALEECDGERADEAFDEGSPETAGDAPIAPDAATKPTPSAAA